MEFDMCRRTLVRARNENLISYFSTKTYVVVTQKNRPVMHSNRDLPFNTSTLYFSYHTGVQRMLKTDYYMNNTSNSLNISRYSPTKFFLKSSITSSPISSLRKSSKH